MDLNHRSPGYEPDGISRLPHLADSNATVLPFETTDVVFFHPLSALSSSRMTCKSTMGGRGGVVLLSSLLLCSMLAGCFGDDDSDQKELIDLVVHYDATNGTIQQSFIGGLKSHLLVLPSVLILLEQHPTMAKDLHARPRRWSLNHQH